MKKLLFGAALLTLLIVSFSWTQPAPPQQSGAAPPESSISFRITFGEKQERPHNYSGKVDLTEGKILAVTPWRFFGADTVSAPASWQLAIKKSGYEDQPDHPRSLATPGPSQNFVPAGVTVTVQAPATATVHVATVEASFDFRLQELQPDRPLTFASGDIMVHRTPTAESISAPSGEEHDYPSLALARNGAVWVAWQSYRDRGDLVYARHSTASGWSTTDQLTDQKADIYQTAIAEDRTGRVWVVWSERSNEDWDLYARSYNGRAWDTRRKLTSGNGPNMSHRLITDRQGNVHLVWIGWRNGQSHVLWSKLDSGTFSQPVVISGPSAWMPDASADSKGNLYIAWDSYQNGNYDIFLRRVNADGSLAEIQQVTRSPRFQAHASVAVDNQDRVWLAWDESGSNWGKDWTHEDQWRSTTLYNERHPRVAVLDNGVWKQPAGDVISAVPKRYNRYIENPKINVDSTGRIWLALQIRTSTAMNRADYWSNNGRWEHFLTTYEADHWTPLMPVTQSSNRPDGAFQLQPAGAGIWSAWVNDSRNFGPPGGPANRNTHHQVEAASFRYAAPSRGPQLEPYAESAGNAALVHANEPADVQRVRAYRVTVSGAEHRILRGDFHRHTEISVDGSGDGSVEDYFRYMLEAAQMDTGIISDHNAGGDNEYTWWRTEKAIDLYHIRNRYTPLFGYERSVNYPNGHRNVVFAQRGVRTLPITAEEQQGTINSGSVLYPYLKQNRGIAMLHSLATNQGSDYRDNDPDIEPLVEIYQGYHAAYEYEGGPRAETGEYQVSVHGGYKPLGFYWNALAKGYKLGVQSSSDHIATHTSYTMIYTPSVARADIVESMRKRHAYGATDNIILDYSATTADGAHHFMGDAFTSNTTPRFAVKVTGTSDIDRIEIIKNGKFVFTNQPSGSTADFTYTDTAISPGESWYYVRVMQKDRNLAWSSPMWVKYP